MFGTTKNGGNMSKPNMPDTSSVNLIGAGTVIEGDVKSNGDVRIDGTVKGTIVVKGKLVVGSTGNVDGEVQCVNADVSGNTRGKLQVSELLMLKATAKVNGDIVTNKLAIEPGANFSGTCSMGAVIKDIKHGIEAAKQEKTAAI